MEAKETVHFPVLYREVLEGLAIKPDGVYLDGTLGGGGHALGIVESLFPKGRLIALDRDSAAISRAEARLRSALSADERWQCADFPVRFAQANYRDFPEVLRLLKIEKVDGFLLDLGLSSDQLADRSRGFSFDSDGPLDLRFDMQEGVPAYELLNRLGEEQIADILFQYGEERCSRRIARAIVESRREQPIEKAETIAQICRRVIPHQPWKKQRIDPATRTFQALRIAVNDELGSLRDFLERTKNYLAPNGRIAIISFHSLEDRIVKNYFRDDPELEAITRKPIEASEQEIISNPRSRSAKLRIAKKR